MSEINSQLLRQFRREVELLKTHKAGRHVDKVLKCDLCNDRPLTLTKRIEEFKRKKIMEGDKQ